MIIILMTFLLSFAEASPELAKTYAPIVTQGICAVPEADEFTRVDYDGDWDPDNNWDNLLKFPRPRTVYWDVIESDKHYFITYAFYFPRDYASWCFWIHCHENDFEGMRVTIEKPGKVIKLEGLAHNFKSELLNPERIEVIIEKEGHGVHPYALRIPDARIKRYTSNDYELRPLKELWEKRNTNLFTGSFTFKNKSYPANFGGSKWILFGFGAAKPPWSWEIWRSDYQKGEWFLDPLRGKKENYLNHISKD